MTWLATAPGGAERSTLELAAAFVAQGLRTSVVWWAAPTPPPYRPAGVDVCVVDGHTYREAVRATPAQVILSSHRTALVDLEFLDGRSPMLAVFRGAALKGREIRVAVVDGRAARLAWVAMEELPWATSWASVPWVAISDYARTSLEHWLSAAKLSTIPNGVSMPLRARPARRCGRTIVIVSRLVSWKRAVWAVRALSDDPSLTIHVCGDGPERDQLDAHAREARAHVVVHGQLTDITDVLDACDLLVHATPDEAFGRAVVEAMRRRLPAVVCDEGGPAELVIDNETGRHYDAADASDLAHKVQLMVDAGPRERDAVSEAAATRSLLYTPEEAAARYIDLFSEVV